MDGRFCTKCGAFKLWVEFTNDRRRASGKGCECLECARERDRQFHSKRSERDSNYWTRRNRRQCQRNPALHQRRINSARIWNKNHPAERNERCARYVIAKLKRLPAWADIDKIKDFYAACPAGSHVDHILPLRGRTVSGLHVIQNLQYLPAKLNSKKSNRVPEILIGSDEEINQQMNQFCEERI